MSRANCSTSTSIFICHSLGIVYFTRLTQNFERSHFNGISFSFDCFCALSIGVDDRFAHLGLDYK